MTGQGGWPLTASCDPEGVPFYGGTYFPPEPRQGMPSFRMVMEAVAESWSYPARARSPRPPGEVRDAARRGRAHRARTPTRSPRQLLDEADARARAAAADLVNGGFGGAPKFPPASALEFLLARGERRGRRRRRLDAMACGGIHDQVGGGFARYSVDAIWLVPHFEKMLYDNALLARAYLHGWQAHGPRALARGLRATRSTGRCARCAAPRAASTRRSTPTPRARRAASTSGRASELREALGAAGLADETPRHPRATGASPRAATSRARTSSTSRAAPTPSAPPGLEARTRSALRAARQARLARASTTSGILAGTR